MKLNDSGSHQSVFLSLSIVFSLFITRTCSLSLEHLHIQHYPQKQNKLSYQLSSHYHQPTSTKKIIHNTMSSSTQHHQSNRSSGWTEQMRDRQARGKNPYSEESDVSDGEPSRLGPQYRASAARPCTADADSCSPMFETHIERERRGEALYILDNHAALMAHAQATGDVCITTALI
jgi:hypothetical protein